MTLDKWHMRLKYNMKNIIIFIGEWWNNAYAKPLKIVGVRQISWNLF